MSYKYQQQHKMGEHRILLSPRQAASGKGKEVRFLSELPERNAALLVL